MSSPNNKADLSVWNNPDDVLRALYRIGKEPVPELRDAILHLLEHDDADIREEALRILLTRWKDREVRPKAISALQSDPAPNVRSAAAFAISATASDSSRSTDTRILLNVLRNETEDLNVRGAAYDALLILHRQTGEAGGKWPFPTKRRDFDPERDVDWLWVQRL
jgi:HEAT repeat protein